MSTPFTHWKPSAANNAQEAFDSEVARLELRDELREKLNDADLEIPEDIPHDSMSLLRGRLDRLASLKKEQAAKRAEDKQLRHAVNVNINQTAWCEGKMRQETEESRTLSQEIATLEAEIEEIDARHEQEKTRLQEIKVVMKSTPNDIGASEGAERQTLLHDPDVFFSRAADLEEIDRDLAAQVRKIRSLGDQRVITQDVIDLKRSRMALCSRAYELLADQKQRLEVERDFMLNQLDEAVASYKLLKLDILHAETDVYKWLSIKVYGWHGEQDIEQIKLRQVAEFETLRELRQNSADDAAQGGDVAALNDYDKNHFDKAVWKAASQWRGFPSGYREQWRDALEWPDAENIDLDVSDVSEGPDFSDG